ncbi:hypothetical protein [Breoghania sp.]|uniref:hypothetical protein n=1 Tax=Breoghania sp. TaxID=2065378 RepID=UPI002AA7D14B|nr:hypothetical protein [Breoghania sp.]
MAVKTLEEVFYADSSTVLTEKVWNSFVAEIATRLRSLEAVKVSWDAVSETAVSVALTRINEVILPLSQSLADMAEFGFLTAASASEVTLAVGEVAEFVIGDETQRELFQPTPFLAITREATVDDYAIGRLNAYDKSTGTLQIIVDVIVGTAGPYSDWYIAGLAGSVPAEVAMLDEVRTARDAAATSEQNAATSEENAAGSEQAAGDSARDAAAALTAFNTSWLGARSEPPAEATVGAQYLDISQTPNRILVLTESGWSPTYSVAIGGLRAQEWAALTEATTVFTVDGGFTGGAVHVNGSRLASSAVALDAENGQFTLAVAATSGDVVTFDGYFSTDATDVYSKAEADAAFASRSGINGDWSVRGKLSTAGIVNPGYGLKVIPANSDTNMLEFRTLDDKRVALAGVLNENSFLIRLYNPATGAFRNGLRFYLTGELTYDATMLIDNAGRMAAPLADGVTGTTQAPGDKSKKIATNEFVANAVAGAASEWEETPGVVISAGSGVFSIAHGLGAIPRVWLGYIRVLVAGSGYNVGDEILIASKAHYFNSWHAMAVWADSTEFGFSCSSPASSAVGGKTGGGAPYLASAAGYFEVFWRYIA